MGQASLCCGWCESVIADTHIPNLRVGGSNPLGVAKLFKDLAETRWQLRALLASIRQAESLIPKLAKVGVVGSNSTGAIYCITERELAVITRDKCIRSKFPPYAMDCDGGAAAAVKR